MAITWKKALEQAEREQYAAALEAHNDIMMRVAHAQVRLDRSATPKPPIVVLARWTLLQRFTSESLDYALDLLRAYFHIRVIEGEGPTQVYEFSRPHDSSPQ